MKKFISAVLIVAILATVSLVTTYATNSNENDSTSTTEGSIISTGGDLDPNVTVARPITKEQLEEKIIECQTNIPVGTIFSNEHEFQNACAKAYEVIYNEDATEDEIRYAYNNVIDTFKCLNEIGAMVGPYLIGDYDYDDIISIKDATDIQMIIAKLNSETLDYTRADADWDMTISIKDVTMVQCYVAGFTDEESCGKVGQEECAIYFNDLYTT